MNGKNVFEFIHRPLFPTTYFASYKSGNQLGVLPNAIPRLIYGAEFLDFMLPLVLANAT